MGNYESKVKKVLDWKAEGVPMDMVEEHDVFE